MTRRAGPRNGGVGVFSAAVALESVVPAARFYARNRFAARNKKPRPRHAPLRCAPVGFASPVRSSSTAVKAGKWFFGTTQQEEAPMGAIGYVTKQQDGSYKGTLRTVSIKAGIEILPNDGKNPIDGPDSQPDYRVFTDDKVEIGAGWERTGKNSGKRYVSLSFAAPEFGPRKLYCNLGRAAGSDDDTVFALIWNPAD
jgi:uncharacterized protein (DUF736 family)